MATTGLVIGTSQSNDTLASTAWSNQANILVNSDTEATESITAKNTPGTGSTTTGWIKVGDFGFDSLIPSGSTITKVEISVRWRMNSAGGIGNRDMCWAISGTRGTNTHSLTTEPTTLETTVTDVTSERSWTRADLLNAVFQVHARGRNGNSTTDPSYRFAWIKVEVTYDPPAATYTQNQFRFYKDDAGANAATARAAQNTNISMVADRNVRLRFNVNAATNPPTQNQTFQLFYSRNGGAYTRVDGASSVVRASSSAQVADSALTTELLAGSGTFNAGRIDTADGSVAGFTSAVATGQDTEMGFSVQVRSSDVSAGDTIDLRVRLGGSDLNGGYTVTPRITVAANPNGEARIPVTDLTAGNQLKTGTATGTVKVRLRKEVNGALSVSANPTATVEIRDGTAGGATVLKTLVTNVSVSDTSTDGALLTYTFDQSGISAPNNAAIWITTTNVVGASIRVLPLEWMAQYEAAPTATKPSYVGMIGFR